MSVRSRLANAAFAVAMAVAPLSAPAQTTDGQSSTDVFGDWLLRCAANDATRCMLSQRIVHSENRSVVAEIGIAPLANGQAGFALVFSVPEGADLSAAPAFRLDGAPEQSAMAWRVCVNGTCQASASVLPDQAAEMDQAGSGIFGYKKYRATQLTLTPVSYDGLAEGLAAMTSK